MDPDPIAARLALIRPASYGWRSDDIASAGSTVVSEVGLSRTRIMPARTHARSTPTGTLDAEKVARSAPVRIWASLAHTARVEPTERHVAADLG